MNITTNSPLCPASSMSLLFHNFFHCPLSSGCITFIAHLCPLSLSLSVLVPNSVLCPLSISSIAPLPSLSSVQTKGLQTAVNAETSGNIGSGQGASRLDVWRVRLTTVRCWLKTVFHSFFFNLIFLLTTVRYWLAFFRCWLMIVLHFSWHFHLLTYYVLIL